MDFIKLDLEGNEIKTLRGASTVKTQDGPAIVMEFGLNSGNEGLYGETCQSFIKLMQQMNYAIYAPWGEPAEAMVLAGYPFWYLFAFPKGRQCAGLLELLKSCFEEASAEVAK